MKTLFALLFVLPLFSIAQQATIHFDIKNSTAKNIDFSLYDDYANPEVLFGESYINVPMVNGKTDWTYKINKPTTVRFYYQSSDSSKQLEYSFFLSPGDDLKFSTDEQKLQKSISVKGKGSENNQPLIQSLHDDFIQTLYTDFTNDSLPSNVLEAIEKKNASNRLVLNNYIKSYKPTEDFIKNETVYVQYFTLINYLYLKGTIKYIIGRAYDRNENSWQIIGDSLITENPIDNDDAFITTGYPLFIADYLTRTKERVWSHRELEQDYCQNVSDKELLKQDYENFLKEKIIDKHFAGKTAEFLYALIFQELNNPKEDNLPEIFKRFKERYPNSEYIPFIEPRIAQIEKRRANTLTDKMILISNTDSLQTFEEVLKLVKGKTVLLDMWGTWCGPCRRDLLTHSAAIKKQFKDKELAYLYIANNDVENESKWRELIAYYNLSGTHILANANLTNDIMTKIEGQGYPSYVIIKKDGSFEKYEGYGLEPEILYQQIDRILKE